MLRILLLLTFLNYGSSWSTSSNDDYVVHSLTDPQLPKGKSDMVAAFYPSQNIDACLIHTTPESFRHYTFRQRINYFRDGTIPIMCGTGTVTNNGVLTVAHLFVREHNTMILGRNIFALYSPIAIFQGLSLDSTKERKWRQLQNSEKTKPIISDFILNNPKG